MYSSILQVPLAWMWSREIGEVIHNVGSVLVRVVELQPAKSVNCCWETAQKGDTYGVVSEFGHYCLHGLFVLFKKDAKLPVLLQ